MSEPGRITNDTEEVKCFGEWVTIEKNILRQVDTVTWSIPVEALKEDRDTFTDRLREGLKGVGDAFMWAYDQHHANAKGRQK